MASADESTAPQTIKLVVRSLDGDVVEVDVEAKSTILAVKDFLQEQIGLAPSLQKLLVGRTALEDDTTLEERCIKDGDVLTLLKMEATPILVGKWQYGYEYENEYEISHVNSQLLFTEKHHNGDIITGVLVQGDTWAEGHVTTGFIRIKLDGVQALSNFKRKSDGILLSHLATRVGDKALRGAEDRARNAEEAREWRGAGQQLALRTEQGRDADAGAEEFYIGERVERRDEGECWRIGYVTNLNPLEVTYGDDRNDAEGYTWDEVRKDDSDKDGSDSSSSSSSGSNSDSDSDSDDSDKDGSDSSSSSSSGSNSDSDSDSDDRSSSDSSSDSDSDSEGESWSSGSEDSEMGGDEEAIREKKMLRWLIIDEKKEKKNEKDRERKG